MIFILKPVKVALLEIHLVTRAEYSESAAQVALAPVTQPIKMARGLALKKSRPVEPSSKRGTRA
jgi:hypothetical protein